DDGAEEKVACCLVFRLDARDKRARELAVVAHTADVGVGGTARQPDLRGRTQRQLEAGFYAPALRRLVENCAFADADLEPGIEAAKRGRCQIKPKIPATDAVGRHERPRAGFTLHEQSFVVFPVRMEER